MSAAEEVNLDGMTLQQAADVLGKSIRAAKAWLNNNGYRVPDNVVRRPRTAIDLQDEIAARIAAAAPSAPCFLCGAARGCSHRSSGPAAPHPSIGDQA